MAQPEKASSKGIGNAQAAEAISLPNGITVNLQDGLHREDLEKLNVKFVTIDGKQYIRAKEASSGTVKEIPLDQNTESIRVYKSDNNKLNIDVIDKPDRVGPDRSRIVSGIEVDAEGYTISEITRRSNVDIKMERQLELELSRRGFSIDNTQGLFHPDPNAKIKMQSENGVQTFKASDIHLDITSTTQKIVVEQSPGNIIDVKVYDMPKADGTQEVQTMRVLPNGDISILTPRTEKIENEQKQTEQKQAFSVKIPEKLLQASKNESLISAEDPNAFSRKNTTEIWNRAFEHAQAYAKEHGHTLSFKGTGALAKGLNVSVNPIELQELSLSPVGKDSKEQIGSILPEKNHLSLLKSSPQLYEEMVKLINAHLKER